MKYYDLNAQFNPKEKLGYEQIYSDLKVFESDSPEEMRKALGRKHDLYFFSSFKPDDGVIKKAGEKGKVFEIPVDDLIYSKGMKRAIIIAKKSFFLKLCIKYHADYVLTSRAKDEYGLRSPKQMIALGVLLGLSEDQARRSITLVPEKVLGE